jgi:hypothetical protein
MRFHLTDGTQLDLNVSGSMLGYRISCVTLDAKDISQMLAAAEAERVLFLQHLLTRFAPDIETLNNLAHVSKGLKDDPEEW